MKLLTVFGLLCAMMALTTAADKEASDQAQGLIPPGEHHVVKRAARCHPRIRLWGWTRYGKRYFRFISHRLTWAQAQRVCESMNANLASVHSPGEYQFIQRVIYRATHHYVPTWIGGSDAQEERYWFWIDGTQFRYANWCRGEPNNVRGREHCLHMNWTGRRCMNDIPCQNRYPFVCVRRSGFLG